ncbi:hypothetical protein BYT27DRAFT_6459318 [Phlegmacium glaucopus]|nr:hypothetical protein BYT27DRAFT_6459318 [Phlegmacium glaucopus]
MSSTYLRPQGRTWESWIFSVDCSQSVVVAKDNCTSVMRAEFASGAEGGLSPASNRAVNTDHLPKSHKYFLVFRHTSNIHILSFFHLFIHSIIYVVILSFSRSAYP